MPPPPTTSASPPPPPVPARKCPICGRPRDPAHAPFCSARCRDRDLLKWLDDGYALPGPAAPDRDDED